MLHSTARIDCSKEGREGAPVDCGAEEDKVGPQHGLDQGQRDGGGLIDDQQLRLPQPLVVLRLNVLHRLYSRAQNVAQHKLTDIISLFTPLSSNALPPVQARCYRIQLAMHVQILGEGSYAAGTLLRLWHRALPSTPHLGCVHFLHI